MRILEKRQNKDINEQYVCLDDLKGELEKSVLNYKEKEIEAYIKLVYNKDIKDMKGSDFQLEL